MLSADPWGAHYNRFGRTVALDPIISADRSYRDHMQVGSDRLLHAIWRAWSVAERREWRR